MHIVQRDNERPQSPAPSSPLSFLLASFSSRVVVSLALRHHVFVGRSRARATQCGKETQKRRNEAQPTENDEGPPSVNSSGRPCYSSWLLSLSHAECVDPRGQSFDAAKGLPSRLPSRPETQRK